jgi:hypothetical protein
MAVTRLQYDAVHHGKEAKCLERIVEAADGSIESHWQQ